MQKRQFITECKENGQPMMKSLQTRLGQGGWVDRWMDEQDGWIVGWIR